MDLNWLLPLAGFALITCGTPGPNNMLLTSAGAAQGFAAPCLCWWGWWGAST